MNKYLKCILKLAVTLVLVLPVLAVFWVGLLVSVFVVGPIAGVLYISGCADVDPFAWAKYVSPVLKWWKEL